MCATCLYTHCRHCHLFTLLASLLHMPNPRSDLWGILTHATCACTTPSHHFHVPFPILPSVSPLLHIEPSLSLSSLSPLLCAQGGDQAGAQRSPTGLPDPNASVSPSHVRGYWCRSCASNCRLFRIMCVGTSAGAGYWFRSCAINHGLPAMYRYLCYRGIETYIPK